MAELFRLVNYYNLPRYMVTWIPSIPLYVSIYTSTMDPSWVWRFLDGKIVEVNGFSGCDAGLLKDTEGIPFIASLFFLEVFRA